MVRRSGCRETPISTSSTFTPRIMDILLTAIVLEIPLASASGEYIIPFYAWPYTTVPFMDAPVLFPVGSTGAPVFWMEIILFRRSLIPYGLSSCYIRYVLLNPFSASFGLLSNA